jgi:hypothetical protein
MNTLLDGGDKPQIDPAKNYVEELVGEGKKFKTVEDLARGKATSDDYIKTLETTLDEMRKDFLREREDNIAKTKLQELIDQMEMRQTNSSNAETQAKELEQQKPFDMREIDSLVSNKLEQMKLSEKQEANFNTVRDKLKERYGDSYGSVIKQQIADLDISEEQLNQMARSNPKVLFRTLGLDQPAQRESFNAPPRSDVRSDTFSPNVQKRTWSYWQKMREEKPDLYFDPKSTVQRMKDYEELGPAFEDGNFKTL